MIFAFAALIGLGLIALWARATEGNIPPPSTDTGEGPPGMAQGITGTMLPDWENTIIFNTAEARGVDARLLGAIRKAEMGGAGKEFGVLYSGADTYQQQATIAANTIRSKQSDYEATRGYSAVVENRYTDEFIAYLGSKYAPVGAANDPGNLNSNWVNNVATWYGRIQYA
jgi:hypothetical protein